MSDRPKRPPPDGRPQPRPAAEETAATGSGFEPTRTAAGPVEPPASAEALPASIGPYRILGKLGQGGMGVVYEAEQLSPRRRVALKVVRGGELVDEGRVRSFQREAETLARLKHPNIAAIYESGRTDDGRHFFAMELVRGTTLQVYLAGRPGPLATDELRFRMALFRKMADAVHHAHQRGVIHRDLKPSNILVSEQIEGEDSSATRSGLPHVKILDFGLARITDGDVHAATMATEVGVIKGTLSYMSPEQTRGHPDEIDVRTDVYALGVILYEMLSGRRPYDTHDRPLVESLRVICEQAPPPLRQSLPGGRRLDADIDTIVGKALEKDKDRRYPSAAMLSEDVDRYLSSQPILARPPTPWYQMRKFAARNRILVAGVAATAGALLVGAIASTAFGLREATQRRAAESARADLESVAAFQGRMLEQVSPQAMGLGIIRATREVIGSALADRGTAAEEIEARLAALEQAARDANTTDVARRVLHENVLAPAARAASAEYASRPAIEARLLETLARTYRALGMPAEAEPHARRVLKLQRETFGPEDPRTLWSAVLLGKVLRDLGRMEEAEAGFMETIEILSRVAGPDAPQTLAASGDLAILEWRRGRYDRAHALLAEVLPRQRRVLSENDPATLDTINVYAATLVRLGRVAEAEGLYAEAAERQRQVRGDDHPQTLAAINNLADVRLALGRVDEAATLFEEALERSTRTLGEAHPRTVQVLRNLARVAQRQGRASEADALHRQVVALFERLHGPDHPATLKAINGRGVFLTATGRYAESRALFEDLLRRADRALGADSVDRATYLHSYGELLLAAGELEQAESLLRRALSVYERGGSAHTGLAHHQLAMIAARRGRRDAALDSLRAAVDRGVARRNLLADPAFAPFRDDPEFTALEEPETTASRN